MFFDRDGDINSIIGVSGKPVAVVGQRGIGKSSILRELARRVKEEPRTRAAYVDCDALESATPGALEQKLSELLFPRQARIGQYYTIDKFPLQTADSVYLFIDEVDRLVQYCDAAKNTSFYARLKAASTGNPAAAVVLAGWCDFWRAVRNPAHVLYRSFEVHQLGPLSEGDAEDLIVTPIESLGLRYDPREGIVSHIRNWSSCHPAHLQLFCERLVERASATRRSKITMEDIHAVEGDNSLYDAVAMPFIHTVSPEDKAVTYAAIHCGTTFTVTDIVERLSRNWEIPAKVNPVMNACERLVIANVFTRVGDRFKFLVNGFPGILRSRQPIDDLMRQMAEEVGRTLNA
jgi:hypothetical protein